MKGDIPGAALGLDEPYTLKKGSDGKGKYFYRPYDIQRKGDNGQTICFQQHLLHVPAPLSRQKHFLQSHLLSCDQCVYIHRHLLHLTLS